MRGSKNIVCSHWTNTGVQTSCDMCYLNTTMSKLNSDFHRFKRYLEQTSIIWPYIVTSWQSAREDWSFCSQEARQMGGSSNRAKALVVAAMAAALVASCHVGVATVEAITYGSSSNAAPGSGLLMWPAGGLVICLVVTVTAGFLSLWSDFALRNYVGVISLSDFFLTSDLKFSFSELLISASWKQGIIRIPCNAINEKYVNW
jgi:hypothetical protein